MLTARRSVSLLALSLLGLAAGAANAALPGLNGRIVFASNRSPLIPGEIYSITATGGQARPVTRNWVAERALAASPVDGRVAFSRGGWLVVRTPRGRERVIARARGLRDGPLWSPNGRWLLYATWVAQTPALSDLFVVRASGGAPRRIGGRLSLRGSAPAWAPDSRRVAVANRGHIESVSIATGRRLRVTRGRTSNSAPAWSPDGTRIAFVRVPSGPRPSRVLVRELRSGRTRRLFSLRADPGELAWAPDGAALLFVDTNEIARVVPLRGRPKVVFSGGGTQVARWSPDGSQIAYWSGSFEGGLYEELWLTRRDGSRRRRLVRLPSPHKVRGFAWTADSRRLLFTRLVDEGEEGVNNQPVLDHDLYTMRPDGSDVRALTRNTFDDSDASFSPDGTQVAYVCGTELCVLDLTTRSRRKLASGLDWRASPSWSPDGSQLVFAKPRPLPVGGRTHDLYLIGADGSGGTLLTRDAWSPSWAPDGRRIAFSRLRELGGRRDVNVHVRDLVSGTEDNISNQSPWWQEHFEPFIDDRADWAPSGDKLVVGSRRGMAEEGCTPFCPWPFDLFALSPAGGHPARLTHTMNSSEPAWSPDGLWIVLSEGSWISVISSAGGRPRKISDGPGLDQSPSWQPVCTRRGTLGADIIAGTQRSDLLCGLGGNDRVDGGRGSDRLFGGRGDDSIQARDGEWDVVGCGPGRDRVFGDPNDLVGIDCEEVSRG